MLVRPDEYQLIQAREEFRYLLEQPRTLESEWQKFFAANPYVLSSALPLKVEPSDIRAFGRPGKSDPDLIIYPNKSVEGSPYGVIELKRHDAKVLKTPRKNILDLTSDMHTAIRQAQEYARTLEAELAQSGNITFLGNDLHIFIVMGLLDKVQEKLQQDVLLAQWRRLLPPGVRLLPYDHVFRCFSSQLPQSIIFLTPVHPSTITNEVGMEFVLIESGSFMMGSEKGSRSREPRSPGRDNKALLYGQIPGNTRSI